MTRIVAFFAAALLLAGCSVAPTQFEVHGKIEPIPQAQTTTSTPLTTQAPATAPSPEQGEAAQYARHYRAYYHATRLRWGLEYYQWWASNLNPITGATGEWVHQKAAYLSIPELQADMTAVQGLTSDAYALKPKLDTLKSKMDALAEGLQIKADRERVATEAAKAARDLRTAVIAWQDEALGARPQPKYSAAKEIVKQIEDMKILEEMSFIAFVYDSSSRALPDDLIKLATFIRDNGQSAKKNVQLTPQADEALQSLIAMADDAERRISSGSSHKPLFFARINGAAELSKKRYTDMETMFPLPAPKS